MSEIQKVKLLPSNFKTLHNQIVNWRSNGRQDAVRPIEPSTVAFVLHYYTNYEQLLAELDDRYPLPQNASDDKLLSWYFAKEDEYRELDALATEYVEALLNSMYGDKWS